MSEQSTRDEFIRQAQVYVPQLKTNWHLDRVAFYGSADVSTDSSLYKQAYTCAQCLARAGKIIVNGGGPGIMQASTQGAESVGGRTIGVTSLQS